MVGPHMPWPMMNIPLSLPNAPSSCCQITRSIGVAPRPPYSFGQCRQAQPASAFFFCQAFATSRMLTPLSWVRPSEDLRSSSSYCFGAFAAIHAFASVRNAASRGVSSKFMFSILGRVSVSHFVGWVERSDTHHAAPMLRWVSRSLSSGAHSRDPLAQPILRSSNASRRIAFAHAVDQRVFPIRQAAERQRCRVGAPVVHVAVELPRKTHAAMHLDVVLGAVLERLRCADPCGSGGFR